ncbi:MAG: nucleotidyltransferase family protein [Dehalococcoidia bacterium]|nr:nucleotidyltransferase family protein [Dehalococcoidia bacterium]MCA9855278.1 nucleotidyltransferase family protein [Dehalococcoidia bacterium]
MISSVLLSAGMSTRMGEPKALLDWEGQPLVAYQVEQLLQGGVDEVIVVLGHKADEIQRQMRRLRCRVLLNALHQRGKAGSLRIGAKGVNRDAEAIVILSVDQPRQADLVRALIEAHRAGEMLITRAAHEGRGGHPIIVDGSLRSELLTVADETGGLKAVVRAHADQTQMVELGPGALVDINTPEELQAARATTPRA